MAWRASSGSAPWSARIACWAELRTLRRRSGNRGSSWKRGPWGDWAFGRVRPAHHPVAESLHAAGKSAGIEAELSADIRRALWEKFAFLAAFSGLTSVARQPMGILRGDPDL